jgi:hypothetical protein
MAEILVWVCAIGRPPLLIGGFFRCREERGPRVHFFPVLSCFVSIAFLLKVTRSYVVFLQIFAPANRLYFFSERTGCIRCSNAPNR